jgi:hypothetical protein
MESTTNTSTAGGPSSGSVVDLDVEVYPEPALPEFALGQKWVFWEQYENAPSQQYSKPTKEDWRSSMQKVAWFHDILTFWQLWTNLPFSKLENFFFDKGSNQIPIYEVGAEKKRIASLGIFQSQVKPMWEDPVNKDNSEIRCSLPNNMAYSLYN